MNDKERQDLIKEMRKIAKEIKNSPAKARKLLIDLGICTPTGRLRKPYR